ncbi:MAG: Holliday junction resolvase RuvX [Peptococcaceae bacterium]|nr:Holliday junction resolvase RuvX [Peptococcaceae bacterium]
MVGRLICFDVGERRIGIAVSDMLGITAQPVETYHRTGNLEKDYEYLVGIIKEQEAVKLVVGLPKNMNNSLGFKAEEIQNFIEEFKSYLPEQFPIDWIDERLTTVQAENVLLEANVSRKKRKKFVDKIAAVFMLQTYMDMH